MRSERRVVVTGIGTINAIGHNIEEFFANLENGVSGAAEITNFDAAKSRITIGPNISTAKRYANMTVSVSSVLLPLPRR